MKNRKGEVVTLLTVGALVVVGVTAVISSLGLNKKTSTNTRANSPIVCEKYLCSEINSTYGKGYWYMKENSPLEYSNSTCTAILSKKSSDYCKGLNVTTTPIPVITGILTDCANSDIYTYYVCGGKWYEDQACKTAITNKTNWCKYGDNAAPSTTCGTEGKECCATSPKCQSASLTCDTTTNKCTPATTGGTCEKGEYFEGGAGSWSSSTPEQICAANNGTYIAKTQQQVGDKRAVCCTVGNVNSQCPQVGLGYACCVQDNRCAGDTNRYRWYGCTGQVCSATIISTRGGPGYLVDCPVGVTKANPEKCEQDLAPAKPSEDCTDNGSYGLLGGCKEKCTANGYECLASPDDASGEKRFCCKAPDPITPNNCTTKNPSSTFTYTCISSGEDASEACNSQTGTMAGSVYDAALSCGEGTKVCCKKAKDPDGGGAAVECNSKATLTCPDKTTKVSYYKSKTTPKCAGKEIDDTCYGTTSTSCESYTWKQIVANGCDGAALPPVDGEEPGGGTGIGEGTVQTNTATEIIANAAQLNGSYEGTFQAVGFTLNGKKYPVKVASPFSYFVTDLKPDTTYTYNTYGSIDGKNVVGKSTTFKTLKAENSAANRCKSNLKCGTTVPESCGTTVLYDFPSAFTTSCNGFAWTANWTGQRSYHVTGKDTAGNCIISCTKDGDPAGTYNGVCDDSSTCIEERTWGPKLTFTVISSYAQSCFDKNIKIVGIGVSAKNTKDTTGKTINNSTRNITENFDVIPKEKKETYTFRGWINQSDKDGVVSTMYSKEIVMSGVAPQPATFEVVVNCN